MANEKDRLENTSIGDATRELLGMLGMLHDFIDKYCDWHVRTYPNLSNNGEVEPCVYEDICKAMNPAIGLLEDEVIERVRDYMNCFKQEAM